MYSRTVKKEMQYRVRALMIINDNLHSVMNFTTLLHLLSSPYAIIIHIAIMGVNFMSTLLIVEDETPIRRIISMHLSLVGHAVLEAEDAIQARSILDDHTPDLALLDIMLPGEDGFSLGNDLIMHNIPVLFLTAKAAVEDRVRGLQMGAWDYILKPFEPAELLARVENILNRTHKQEKCYTTDELVIDFDSRQVHKSGKLLPLTSLEFDLLSLLVRRRNIAISRDELLSAVWGYDYVGETRTVDVHIQRLRSKIGNAYIETVYKYGYRFQEQNGR